MTNNNSQTDNEKMKNEHSTSPNYLSEETLVNYLLDKIQDVSVINKIIFNREKDYEFNELLDDYDGYIKHFNIRSYEEYNIVINSQVETVQNIVSEKISNMNTTPMNEKVESLSTDFTGVPYPNIVPFVKSDTEINKTNDAETRPYDLYPEAINILFLQYSKATETSYNPLIDIFIEITPFIFHKCIISENNFKKACYIISQVSDEILEDKAAPITGLNPVNLIMKKVKKYETPISRRKAANSMTFLKSNRLLFSRKNIYKSVDLHNLIFYSRLSYKSSDECVANRVYDNMHPFLQKVNHVIASKTNTQTRLSLAIRHMILVKQISAKTVFGYYTFDTKSFDTLCIVADMALEKYLHIVFSEWSDVEKGLYPIKHNEKRKGIQFSDLVKLAYNETDLNEQSRIIQTLAKGNPQEILTTYKAFEGILRMTEKYKYDSSDDYISSIIPSITKFAKQSKPLNERKRNNKVTSIV